MFAPKNRQRPRQPRAVGTELGQAEERCGIVRRYRLAEDVVVADSKRPQFCEHLGDWFGVNSEA